MNKATLAIITDELGAILLGEKHQGAKLGAGRRNGPGGDLEEGETVEECVKRETLEESRIEILAMKKLGVVTAHVQEVPKLEVHVFHVLKFAGTPQDTDAMKNWRWHLPTELPFDTMHGGDRHWFPEMQKRMESEPEKEWEISLFYERPGEGFIRMEVR